jgi:AcrR family transcriptional regulator
MEKRRRTQQERVAESRAKLIQATAELIAEGGYEAATAAEIGRRAGYSRSMVGARFGSRDKLLEAVVRSAYEAPLTSEQPEALTGLERVLARLDTMARLVDESPDLMRMIFAVEFRAAGNATGMTTRVAVWIDRLRVDVREAIEHGQRDHSIRGDLDTEATAHAIVVEGVGSAFMWTVDPEEDFGLRIAQWRARTRATLAPE